MSIDLAQAKAIFLQAAEQTSAASRQALLTKACGDDAELRQHVEVLLAAHEQAGSFLEQGALAREATLDPVQSIPSRSQAMGRALAHWGSNVVYLFF